METWLYQNRSSKNNVDSLGYYLSAYLTDLPFDEAILEKADFSKGVKTRNDKNM